MKLLYCVECTDIIKLKNVKFCSCGACYGYQDGIM